MGTSRGPSSANLGGVYVVRRGVSKEDRGKFRLEVYIERSMPSSETSYRWYGCLARVKGLCEE